jgi:hypothetical protein
LASIEESEFIHQSQKRNGEIVKLKLGCKIRAIRKVQTKRGDNKRWMKIEGFDFRMNSRNGWKTFGSLSLK